MNFIWEMWTYKDVSSVMQQMSTIQCTRMKNITFSSIAVVYIYVHVTGHIPDYRTTI